MEKKQMVQLGIRVERKGEKFIASCKRLDISTTSHSYAFAIQTCRDLIIECLRQNLIEIGNQTEQESFEAFEIDMPSIDENNVEISYDETEVETPIAMPRSRKIESKPRKPYKKREKKDSTVSLPEQTQ